MFFVILFVSLIGLPTILFYLVGTCYSLHNMKANQILEKREIEKGKNDRLLTEMVEYHKKSPTIHYKI